MSRYTHRIDGEDISLEEQLRAAKRELALRRGVYPKLAGGLTNDRQRELRAMAAIVATLEGLTRCNPLGEALNSGDGTYRP